MDERIKIDLAHNWHPFTQMEQLNETPPLLIERAEGVKLYASDGKVYYDTVASWWCNIHGHCRKEISDAISKQAAALDHILFAAITHDPAVSLSKKLCGIAPNGLSRVFYSDNGSCSVEIALKMSAQYWQNIGQTQKRRFICFDRGYHGDTIGAMSVGGIDLYTAHFKHLMFDSIRIPTPYCYRCPMRLEKKTCGCACIEYLEKALDKHAAELAAVIMEPMLLGAGGMIIYPAEYIKRARELTTAHNVHLIFDEVTTGFGRTAKMFAADHANVSPDLMCLSKGLTGGTLPLAATLVTEAIFDAFAGPAGGTETFYHGHTFTANPIACAAANANLALFETENTLANAAYLQARLTEDFESYKTHPLVGDVRVIGCCAALELVKDKTTKEPLSAADMAKIGFYKRGFDHGIILRPVANVVYLFLPLVTVEPDLQEMLNLFRQLMNTVC
ncbi:MAG: adenosylmethionine--8-amino-7-oxononanoate transaminase [Armatimonadetes bacterium]|nr:adenosylmethionine--8-amino-7-oxononanoate transaminase [Armatimonadota bacterium]